MYLFSKILVCFWNWNLTAMCDIAEVTMVSLEVLFIQSCLFNVAQHKREYIFKNFNLTYYKINLIYDLHMTVFVKK